MSFVSLNGSPILQRLAVDPRRPDDDALREGAGAEVVEDAPGKRLADGGDVHLHARKGAEGDGAAVAVRPGDDAADARAFMPPCRAQTFS